ncbi:MAG: cytochrome C [Ahrensia sp.]|nr:cytochrome C [Ahrensia sp.]|tara:strand:+ start:31931 stop:32395 length:465 start_codon:yes stop_codon:yes gene_type:complete
MMLKPATALAAAALALTTFSGLAFAHSSATGIVKQRMGLMEEIAESMKQVGSMIRGQTDFDAETVRAAAARMADHAGRMTDMFPRNSTSGPSEALPAIWEDWDGFAGLAGELEAKAVTLSQAAENAQGVDEIRPHFAELGRTCAACHEDFRKAD